MKTPHTNHPSLDTDSSVKRLRCTRPDFSPVRALALCLLLLTGGMAHAADDGQQAVTLVTDGQPTSVIVVNKGDRVMRTDPYGGRSLWQVVLDFQRIIEKMSGAKLPIVLPEEAPPEGNKIFIGEAAPSSPFLADEKGMDPRGYWIEVGPKSVALRGKNEGATINAIYGFLQDTLGARWFFPSELFEVIPNRPTVSVPFTQQRVNPSYKGGMWITTSGLNDDNAVWEQRMRRDVGAWRYQAPGVENLYRILDPDIYGKSHPEFYALLNGQRVVPAHNDGNAAQPCLSNPQLVEEVIKHVRQYFDENPNALMMSISENDSDVWCECDKCRAMDFPPLETADGAVQHSDRFFAFANKVARAIAESHPGKMVGALAYLGTVTAPKNIGPLEPNIMIGLCQDNSQHYDPDYKAKDLAIIDAWKNAGLPLMAHDYTSLGWLLPRYNPRLYAEHLRDFHERGGQAVYTESHTHWPTFGPEMYMDAQLFWDLKKDPGEILDDLFYGLFGKEAGAEMKAYYEVFEKAWMRLNSNRKGTWFEGWSYLHEEMAVYTLADLDAALGHLKKAKTLTKDPLILKRIEYIAHNFSYAANLMRGWLTSDQLDAQVNEHDINTPEEAARILKMLQTVADTVKNEDRIYKETLFVDPISSKLYKNDWDDHFGIVRGQWAPRCEYAMQQAAAALLRYYDQHGQKAGRAALKKELPEAIYKAAEELAHETLGPELLVHGDMSSPEALNAWKPDGGKVELTRLGPEQGNAGRSGSPDLQVTPTFEKALGGVVQSLRVAPLTKYRYSYWYKCVDRGMMYASVTPSTGEPNLMGNVERQQEWTRVSGTFETPEKCWNVAVSFRGDKDKRFVFDDASVREVLNPNLLPIQEAGAGFPDWKNPTITLNTAEQIGTGSSVKAWRGAGKFSALACLGWQEEGLRLVVKVSDPEHSQRWAGSAMWNGDSIQFGINTAGDGDRRSFNSGASKKSDFLYGLSLPVGDGKSPELFRWNAPEGQPTGSLPNDEHHKFSVQRDGNTTLYDVLISWNTLGISPKDKKRFGFNLVVFDSFQGKDGKPELIWLQLAPGIAGSQGLAPALWKTFVITRKLP